MVPVRRSAAHILLERNVSQRRHPRCRRSARSPAALRDLSPTDVVVESSVGTVGFLNISTYPSIFTEDDSLQTFDSTDAKRMQVQDLETGGIEARLYTGRIIRGESANARVLLKAYPARAKCDGITGDQMAANEFLTYASLQAPSIPEVDESPYLSYLLGAFQATEGLSQGEQWLVFRKDGTVTAAEYAAQAAEATRNGTSVGDYSSEFLDRFDQGRPLRRRGLFLRSIMLQLLRGVRFLHSQNRLHQSLGPGSLFLTSIEENSPGTLQVRLSDLAFAVDISDAALGAAPTVDQLLANPGLAQPKTGKYDSLSENLWLRAAAAGAVTADERRAFGKADDIYAAGLLVAYLAFVPLCAPNAIDGPRIQKLLESTFQLDVFAARDFCAADDSLELAVDFLNCGGSDAGWSLLQGMLQPDWRQRPTAEQVLQHPFLGGKLDSIVDGWWTQ